jgi:hypothetical protein
VTAAASRTGAGAAETAGVTARLCTWLAGVDLDAVPTEVRERAMHLVLDGLAWARGGPAGEYANRATGRTGRTNPLPGLVLEILRTGGVLPQLAAAGYLPEEAAAAIRSGAINAAAASGSSA